MKLHCIWSELYFGIRLHFRFPSMANWMRTPRFRLVWMHPNKVCILNCCLSWTGNTIRHNKQQEMLVLFFCTQNIGHLLESTKKNPKIPGLFLAVRTILWPLYQCRRGWWSCWQLQSYALLSILATVWIKYFLGTACLLPGCGAPCRKTNEFWLVTDRIRSTTIGYVFTGVSVNTGGGGYPSPRFLRSLVPGLFLGG